MSEPTKSAWDGYRRWRKRFWIAVAIIPLIFAIFGGATAVAVMVFVPLLIATTLFQEFKCPRCGKTFFYNRTWIPSLKNCVHCGLPKWEEADYVNPPPKRYTNRSPSISEMAADVSNSARERDSRFLLLVLRDDPGAIHLRLDSEGWADINNLLTRANRYGFKLTRENLGELLTASEASSFEWDEEGDRIRVVPD